MMTIHSLPRGSEVLARWRALVILDHVLGEDPDYHEWDLRRGEDTVVEGVFNNGCGDQLYAHWRTDELAILWGFAHESQMTPYREDPPEDWPGLLAALPAHWSEHRPMEGPEAAPLTFALWFDGEAWQQDSLNYPSDVVDPDGSSELLGPLLSDVNACERVTDMYELGSEARDDVLAILAGEVVAADRIQRLRSDADVDEVLRALAGLPA